MFGIEMWPAGFGDCLYIEYGKTDAPNRVLIDAGPHFARKDYPELDQRVDVPLQSDV